MGFARRACYHTAMFHYFETLLLETAKTLPLIHFAWFASMVEEIIAPIPSPLVMLVTGSLAKVQGFALWYLIPLAVAGAFGKTVGALVVYTVSDIAEDIVMRGRVARFLGVTHEHIESLGARLVGGPRDYLLMTLARALPIIPSVVLSVGSGILSVPRTLFLVSTFLGTIIRDGIYLYAGYMGISALHAFINHSNTIESYVQYALAGILAALLGALAYHRLRSH